MQANKSRKIKGTPICGHNPRLDIIEDYLSPSHEEVEDKRILKMISERQQ